MTGKDHQFRTGWLLMMSTAFIAVAIVCSRAVIRGSSSDALVGKVVSPIQISAEWTQEWHEDQGTVGLFRGLCRIVQGTATYSSESMVVWAHESEETAGKVERLTVYMEGDVRIDDGTNSRTDQACWLDLDAARGITLSVRGRATDRPGKEDPLYKRAIDRHSGPTRSKLKQTQLTVPASPNGNPGWQATPVQNPTGMRQVRISPRSFGTPFSISSELSDTNPPMQVTLIKNGVNILVEGLPTPGGVDPGMIDLSADNAVVWTDNFSEFQQQSQDQNFQVYLEGNIVIRQHDNRLKVDNLIKANRAFYDARDNRALILDAEFLSYYPALDATIRMRADSIRQNAQKDYHAQNAWVTTSRYGFPGYRLQASDVFFKNYPSDFSSDANPPQVDPATGQYVPKDNMWVTALNSQILVDQFPIFYAPKLSGPVDDFGSNSPLQNVGFGLDRIFGTQFRTTWDAFSLLGINRPTNPNVKLSLMADYLSYRGPAGGFKGSYTGTDEYGHAYVGNTFAYGVIDSGLDNLGFDRRSLIPPNEFRGMFQWQHRHNFDEYDAKLYTELGLVDYRDRNFQEEYFRTKFDQDKDVETKAQWQQLISDSGAYSVLVRPQVNYFENNTQWLPRGDLYFLGEPVLDSLVNYSSHSSAGYSIMNPATPPSDPAEVFTPLPYMRNASGAVAQTRHEFDAPFNLGPLKVVPFVLGEAAYWGEGLTTDSGVGRLYGRGGVRATLAFEKVFPSVQSDVFNVNGLNHKSLFDAEYSISGVTQQLNNIAQWNEFDDNAQERFRMRLVQDTFGGILPPQFDPRFYAVRTGAGATVTAPYNELVANQQVFRLNWHQRLQTKVGPPEFQRIKDWMTLDMGVSVFPDANRDDFGSTLGLANSRYVWNVGDRTSIVASSMYDFFNQGQQLWSVGVTNQRGLRGSMYFGVMQVKGGTLDSQIATVSYSYVMSPKWISTASTAYDIAQARSGGQSFTLTRVGEWLLVHLGGNVDVSKNNVGLTIMVEPRIGRSAISSTKLGSLLGSATPQQFY